MNKDLQKEILGIRELAGELADKGSKPILKAYKKALEEVRTDIAKIYTEYAVNGVLQVSRAQKYTILKELEGQLIKQARTIGLIDLNHTTKILEDVYTQSYYKTAFAIDKGVDVAINFAILKPEFVRAAVNMPIEGVMFSDRIWKNKELLVNRVRSSVEKAMTQGVSIDRLARDVKNNFGSSAYESQRLIRTEIGRCQGLAQKEIYESSGVVNKIMWSASLDDVTRDEHRELDGKQWDIDDPDRKYAPDGINCRCSTIPVVEGWKPTTRRENIAGEDGKPIIDYQDYNSWQKSRGIT